MLLVGGDRGGVLLVNIDRGGVLLLVEIEGLCCAYPMAVNV